MHGDAAIRPGFAALPETEIFSSLLFSLVQGKRSRFGSILSVNLCSLKSCASVVPYTPSGSMSNQFGIIPTAAFAPASVSASPLTVVNAFQSFHGLAPPRLATASSPPIFVHSRANALGAKVLFAALDEAVRGVVAVVVVARDHALVDAGRERLRRARWIERGNLPVGMALKAVSHQFAVVVVAHDVALIADAKGAGVDRSAHIECGDRPVAELAGAMASCAGPVSAIGPCGAGAIELTLVQDSGGGP
jgi:hypothetical protein